MAVNSRAGEKEQQQFLVKAEEDLYAQDGTTRRVTADTNYAIHMINTQRFSSIFQHYARVHLLCEDDLEYKCGTYLLQNGDTPQSVQLNTGDTILVRRKTVSVEFSVQAEQDLYLYGSEYTIRRVTAEVNYRCLMLENQRFSSLFRHYAKYHGLCIDDLDFYFDNKLLVKEDTPGSVQLQTDATIKVRHRGRLEAVKDDKAIVVDNKKLLLELDTKRTETEERQHLQFGAGEHVGIFIKADEDLYLQGSEKTIQRVTAGTNYHCSLLKTEKFSSLFRHYARRHGLRKEDLEYIFVDLLEDEGLPESVRLIPGDTIMVRKRRTKADVDDELLASDDTTELLDETRDHGKGAIYPRQIELFIKPEEDLAMEGSERVAITDTKYTSTVNSTDEFSSLFRDYAKVHELCEDDLEYSFVNVLKHKDTPDSVHVLHGDTIMVRKRRKTELPVPSQPSST